MTETIHPLFPPELWKHFKLLMETPRGSLNTEQIQSKIMEFGRSLSLEVQQDAAGNVVIRKPATLGRESAPSICVQAHTDMVCVRDPDSTIDPETMPLKPLLIDDPLEGPILRAQGTTLGADNGIGACALMALLCDDKVSHGPLECLFTIDEEIGMVGALKIGNDMVKSQFLINTDNMEDGSITVACAGGTTSSYDFRGSLSPLDPVLDQMVIKLTIDHCHSGHSGFEAHLGRANPISLLGRLLRRGERAVEEKLKKPSSLRLCHLDGGLKRNVLPTAATSLFVLPNAAEHSIFLAAVTEEMSHVKAEFARPEPFMRLSLTVGLTATELPFGPRALPHDESHKVVSLLITAPHGVQRMSLLFPGTTSLSSNFFRIETLPVGQPEKQAEEKTDTDTVNIRFSFLQRALLKSEVDLTLSQLESFAELGGLIEVPEGRATYAGWLTSTDTQLWKVTEASFREIFGYAPRVTAVHAGYECGVLKNHFPWLECISLGPTIKSPHTTHESLYLKTVPRYWNLMKSILAKNYEFI